MSRKLRDIIPVIANELQPKQVPYKVVLDDIARRRARSKSYYDRKVSAPLKEFTLGEKVFVKPNPANKHKPWMYGEVIKTPAPRSCVVQTQMGYVRRNHRQIRKATMEPINRYDVKLDDEPIIEDERTVLKEETSNERAETQSPILLEEPNSKSPAMETGKEVEVQPRRSTRIRRMPRRFNFNDY